MYSTTPTTKTRVPIIRTATEAPLGSEDDEEEPSADASPSLEVLSEENSKLVSLIGQAYRVLKVISYSLIVELTKD